MRLRLLLAAALALVALVTVAQVARARLATRAPPGQRVDVGGRALHLVCAGSGQPTVVLEAGLNDGAAQWSHVFPSIGGRVCAYDRAGLGFSDESPRSPTLGQATDDLEAVLRAGHIDGPLVLVGHSFGALVVRAFQARHPERVAAVLLVDPAHEVMLDERALLSRALEDTAAQFTTLGLLSRSGLLALAPRQIPARGLTGDTLEGYRARLAAGPYFRAAAEETRHFEANLVAARALPSLGAVPLVVISRGRPEPLPGLSEAEAARWEAMWQRAQRASAELSNRSQRVVAPGVGHQVPAEAPELVAEWARRLATPRAAF